MNGNDVSDKSSSGALNEHSSQSHQNYGQHSQPSGYGSGAVSAHDDAVARNSGGDNGSQKTGTSQPVEHGPTIQRAGRSVAITNGVLALATLGTLIITAFQLNSMNGQLEQMRLANELTKKAVETSLRQANAAEDANNISRKALLSDRAWVHLYNSEITGDINTSDKLVMFYRYRNVGKNIARRFGSYFNAFVYDVTEAGREAGFEFTRSFAQQCMKGEKLGGDLVYPVSGNDFIALRYNLDLSRNRKELISGSQGIMFLSCVNYESEVIIRHTSSCRLYEHGKTEPGSPAYCGLGNDAD